MTNKKLMQFCVIFKRVKLAMPWFIKSVKLGSNDKKKIVRG